MKKMTGRTKWFVALLAVGCVLLHTAAAQVALETATTNAAAPAGDRNTNGLSAVVGASETNAAVSNAAATIESKETNAPTANWQRRTREREALVVFGKNVELKEGESAEAVVVIGGSAKVSGKVRNAVVVIGGDVEIEGEVGDAVVAVLGSVKVGKGATIHGDVVAVGGKVEEAEGATVNGHVQEVDLGGMPFGRQVSGLKDWVVHCALKLRPLAPQVGWVWVVAAAFLLLYFLITVAFPKPVAACVEELTRRPATTFFIGLLTKLLVPLVVLVLAATGIGLVVVPFILAAVLLGALLGKAALLQYLGKQIGRQFGVETLQQPLVAFLLGWVLITLFYMIPILGLLIFAVTGLWGTGAAVMAMFGGLRREAPERPAPAAPAPPIAPPPVAGIPPMPVVSGAAPMIATPVPAGAVNPVATATPIAAPATWRTEPPVIPSGIQTAAPEALALSRAGFWARMGAAFLDVVLVGILSGLAAGSPLGRQVAPWSVFLVWLAYFAGMWTWRGTTIGGIVLNLKVVRFDGQPVTFPVALVRALAAAFSAVVLFLGFLWIAWSRDKQAWHDKIAGTVVVRQPRGMSLICL